MEFLNVGDGGGWDVAGEREEGRAERTEGGAEGGVVGGVEREKTEERAGGEEEKKGLLTFSFSFAFSPSFSFSFSFSFSISFSFSFSFSLLFFFSISFSLSFFFSLSSSSYPTGLFNCPFTTLAERSPSSPVSGVKGKRGQKTSQDSSVSKEKAATLDKGTLGVNVPMGGSHLNGKERD